MSRRRLIVETNAASCYFRSSVDDGERKALVQITERCNLHCAHCFVSSTREGMDISLEHMRDFVVPRLIEARVQRVTLTGGEPFVHPHLLEICELFVSQNIHVGICTNATQTTAEHIFALVAMGGVHINVSFDGFRAETHGKFRGNRASFATTLETTRMFASAGLLQGLLSTPNTLTEVNEFRDLCAFGLEIGAEYVLMNPLSSFGRGVKSKGKLAAPADMMSEIRKATSNFAEQGLDAVHIRFPNDGLPLSGCDAGKLIYVFADGAVAICPYLVFAADTQQSQHDRTEFLAGNILEGGVAELLDGYDMSRLAMGNNNTCPTCELNSSCGKGCPAAVVANGGRIGAVDAEQCPKSPTLLTIGRRP